MSDPHPEEPRLRGVSKGEATSGAFILRDARSALLRMRRWTHHAPRNEASPQARRLPNIVVANAGFRQGDGATAGHRRVSHPRFRKAGQIARANMRKPGAPVSRSNAASRFSSAKLKSALA